MYKIQLSEVVCMTSGINKPLYRKKHARWQIKTMNKNHLYYK